MTTRASLSCCRFSRRRKRARSNRPTGTSSSPCSTAFKTCSPNDSDLIQQRALATPGAPFWRLSSPTLPRTAKRWTPGSAKRLWTATGHREDLDKAIHSYSRGYFIKDDYYNGINLAFLLNVRAAASEGDDTIADRVLARRIRSEVLRLCDTAPQSETLSADARFWITATKIEALLGPIGRAPRTDGRAVGWTTS